MRLHKTKPLVGVSSCLLGHEVRFDGGHKRNQIVLGVLNDLFEYRAFCPELEAGMRVPRQPIRLLGKDGAVHAVGVRDADFDVTERLKNASSQYCASIVDALSGYIVKKGSPSCGMERVKLYNEDGIPVAKTQGVFTGHLMQENPLLPVEEEGRLANVTLFKNFLIRVFVYHDWKSLVQAGPLSKHGLIEFHTRHKYLLLSHNEGIYRKLGKLLAQSGKNNIEEINSEYIAMLMNGLKRLPTRSTHSNVLYHMAGFFKRSLSRGDKLELVQVIESYRLGKHALVAPVTLLMHYLRLNHSAFLAGQTYLEFQKLLAQFHAQHDI